jgi:hypothetical protein
MKYMNIHIPDKYEMNKIKKDIDISFEDVFSNIIYINTAIEYFIIELFTSFDINIQDFNTIHKIDNDKRLNIFNTFVNGYTLFKHIVINIFLYSNNCRASIFYGKIATLYYIELIKQGTSFMDAYEFIFKKIIFKIPKTLDNYITSSISDFLKSYLDMYDYVLTTTLKHVIKDNFTTFQLFECIKYKLAIIFQDWKELNYSNRGVLIYDNIQIPNDLNYVINIEKNDVIYPVLFPYFIDFSGNTDDLLKFKVFINSI